MTSVELFVGAGGLAMGIANSGFEPKAVIEWDKDACDTIRENQARGVSIVKDWPVHQMDVREFDYRSVAGSVDLVAGGPPCQPFSLGGKHGGYQDNRDMFPEAVRAVRELQPRAFIFENVKGLLRQSFSRYFEYIILQLTHPEIIRKPDEDWTDHQTRLERHHTRGVHDGLHYNVVFQLLNAADHGVPQKRERVFMVGFRSDLGQEWSFPKRTHDLDALLWDQWVSEEYWERHKVAKRNRPEVPERFAARVKVLQQLLIPPTTQSWVTVRDAVAGLPDPEFKEVPSSILNHRFFPGARQYPGHTGSHMDEPAKTLKAGSHGVPGGENMLLRPDGSVRYFSIRESARIQTFPDDYLFHGSWTEIMRQLGNAVPVKLGNTVSDSVAGCLGRELKGRKAA